MDRDKICLCIPKVFHTSAGFFSTIKTVLFAIIIPFSFPCWPKQKVKDDACLFPGLRGQLSHDYYYLLNYVSNPSIILDGMFSKSLPDLSDFWFEIKLLKSPWFPEIVKKFPSFIFISTILKLF